MIKEERHRRGFDCKRCAIVLKYKRELSLYIRGLSVMRYSKEG